MTFGLYFSAMPKSSILRFDLLLFGLLRVEHIDEDAGQEAPDAHVANGPGRVLPEPVHVVEDGDAVFDHLKAGELCPPVDVLPVNLASSTQIFSSSHCFSGMSSA